MASRTPHCDDHDVFVSLERVSHAIPSYAYAIAKKTYRIGTEQLEPAPARPLRNDPYAPGCDPPLPPASDFWWQKRKTDVVVEGSAWAPGGKPVARSEVSCRVGSRTKRIAVFGRRVVEYTSSGRPFVGPPEPFTSIPLDDAHAYGGIDPRVPLGEMTKLEDVLRFVGDYAGMYPRNPVGKGFLVVDEPVSNFELPNLEDPDDLLTDERLVVGHPGRWFMQPLPWTLGWQHGMALQRLVHIGTDATLPVPRPTDMKEVQRGYLPADYREQAADDASDFRFGFYQEASLGLCFPPLAEGTPVAVEGAHPEHTLSFALPPPPTITIDVEGHAETPPPRLTAVIIEPDRELVSLVYMARTPGLPRAFIPGIHPVIPLTATVDGGPALAYVAPPVKPLP